MCGFRFLHAVLYSNLFFFRQYYIILHLNQRNVCNTEFIIVRFLFTTMAIMKSYEVFKSIDAIQIHLSMKHPICIYFKCVTEKCSRSFNKWNSFRKHIQKKHAVSNRFKDSNSIEANPVTFYIGQAKRLLSNIGDVLQVVIKVHNELYLKISGERLKPKHHF